MFAGVREYSPAQLDAILRSEREEADGPSKYRLPDSGSITCDWIVNPLSCKTCGRQGSPNFYNDAGICLYCQQGIN